MIRTVFAIALISISPLVACADSFNQTITAIFGSGNPDTGWTTDTASGVTLALRGKDRDNGATPQPTTPGVYEFPTGFSINNPARAKWNWEFSIDSGSVNLSDDYDYYIAVDVDPSECADYVVINALTSFNDNSYGTNATANGQGTEGTAAALAGSNTIAQNSQNIVFAGGDPDLDATYDYELWAVAQGDDPTGNRIVSVAIKVVVGTGGAVCDSDNDGVPDDVDHCVPSVLGGFVDVGSGPTSIANNGVDANGCSIQDLVNECQDNAKNHGQYVSCIAQLANDLRKSGAITNKQSTEMKNGAAKSQVGK
jgi:hypothetical protein